MATNMLRGEGYNTAKAREEALADAESKLVCEGHKDTVSLYPKQIKIMPELFQPRMFSYDGRATNEKHVKTLVDAIETDGKIEPPPLVIKLRGKGFVIVDGHRTLAAYKKVKENEQIVCEWFPGTARQAWDEANRRNRKDKLPMHPDDKSQQAWERVLIGGYTAPQINKITGISVRTVKTMREVKRAAVHKSWLQRPLIETVKGTRAWEEGWLDRETLALECLKSISWKRAWLLYAGVKDREITDEENASVLVRRLRGNVPDKLMLEPKVVALALKLYNHRFPETLTAAWEELKEHPEAFEKAKSAERRHAKQYQERAAKAAETRAIAAAAEKQYRKDAERLRSLEEAAKARAALKSTTAAQEGPGAPQGGDGSPQGHAEPPGASGA
jgi:ParB-like chromosome segregation protein Spo0J